MFRTLTALGIASCLLACKPASKHAQIKSDAGVDKPESPRVTVVEVADEASAPIGDLLKNLRKGMTPSSVRKSFPPDLNWCLDSNDEKGGMTEGFEMEDDVFIAFKYTHAKAAKSKPWTLIGSPEEDLRLERAMAIPILMQQRDHVYSFTRQFECPLVVVVYGEESESGPGE